MKSLIILNLIDQIETDIIQAWDENSTEEEDNLIDDLKEKLYSTLRKWKEVNGF